MSAQNTVEPSDSLSEFSDLAVAAIQMMSGTRPDGNMKIASQLIKQAVDQGARLVLLPEYFCLMGQHDTDKLTIRETDGHGPLQQFLSEQSALHGVWLVGGTIPLESSESGRIYNACLVYGPDGYRIARYDKIHLFGFDNGKEVFTEADTIVPGHAGPTAFASPVGPTMLSVCYDLRFPELYRAIHPVNLILVPSAFTYTTGRAHWEILLRARAIENQCYVLAAAQGGKHESGRRTWGHSVLIDPWGTVLDELAEGPGVVYGEVSIERLRRVRTSLPALEHRVLF